jgi:hypothetical protein
MHEIQEDSRGHHYIDVANIRVTFVPQSSWAETGHGIRLQAYRDGETGALHMGAELHLSSVNQGYALISAIAALLAEAPA